MTLPPADCPCSSQAQDRGSPIEGIPDFRPGAAPAGLPQPVAAGPSWRRKLRCELLVVAIQVWKLVVS